MHKGSMDDVRRNRASKTKKKCGKGVQIKSAAEEARRREVLKETLREKLELEHRALQIVERLLADRVTEQFLIDCARMITTANYKDVVEERSISKQCGYPLCPNKLTNVPTQQYKISTKSNKVYDITERKCFCCNFCYKASKCFEVQIPKSPLWLRKEERPPDIRLMQQGDGGSSGLEVKLNDRPVSVRDVENPVLEPAASQGGVDGNDNDFLSDTEQDFVSSVVSGQQQQDRVQPRVHWGKTPTRHENDQEEALHQANAEEEVLHPKSETENGGETEAAESSSISPTQTNHDQLPPVKITPLEHRLEESRDRFGRCSLGDDATSDTPPESTDAKTLADLNISQVGMSKKGAAELRSLLQTHSNMTTAKSEAPSLKRSLLEALRHTFLEWRTEETMKFLYGSDYASTNGAALKSQEEEEEKEEELDEDDLEDGEETEEKVTKEGKCRRAETDAPAPDYETLREETEQLNLQVKKFYAGVCVLPEEVEESSAGKMKKRTEDRGKEPLLPLIDSHSQHLIQKRITVEKLSRSLRDIVGPLHITMSDIINDINNLVRTFRFTNANIIHKPPEWTLIAVVLLYVLTESSPLLRESMARPTSVEYISSLMQALNLHHRDLQNLVQIFKPEE